MNALHLEKSWDMVKEKLKEQNIELTDEDLQLERGREDELIDRLAKKLKKDPAAIKAWIESISFNKGKAS